MACEHETFTNLPPNLMPYSRWTLDHHLAALQTYEWSRSVYRCTSQMLGVTKPVVSVAEPTTAYRWVSGFGYQLLPVAALFGVVRSSLPGGRQAAWWGSTRSTCWCPRTTSRRPR